jgi:hypothetical protein
MHHAILVIGVIRSGVGAMEDHLWLPLLTASEQVADCVGVIVCSIV